MIGLVMRLLGVSSGAAWAVVLAVATVGAGGLTTHHVLTYRWARQAEVKAAVERGIAEERGKWEAARQDEQKRQAAVNEAAVAAALAEVNRLRTANADLEAKITEADHAADKDPRADDWCLSLDAVRRLRLPR